MGGWLCLCYAPLFGTDLQRALGFRDLCLLVPTWAQTPVCGMGEATCQLLPGN